MSPTKLLQINPTLFSVNSNGNSKSLKKKAIKPEIKDTKINSNRKALLAKIKDFQKKENKHKNKNNESKNSGLYEIPKSIAQDIQDFEGEFNKSLNFLQELSNKHTLKKRDKKNRTLKNHVDVGNNVNLELPQELKEAEINIHVPAIQPIKMHQPIRVTNGGQTQSSVSVPNVPPPIIVTPKIDPFIQKPIIIPVPNHIVANSSSESTSHVIFQENSQLQSTPVLPKVALSPLILSTPPPPYSNLKGSLKPTYREWLQKTQKNYKQKNDNISFSDKNQISEISNLSTIPIENKNNIQYKNKTNKSGVVLSKVPIEKISKKTRTLKYTLGKKGDKIGVLIKNSNTRKKIKDDFLKLKRKNISEIKDVLRNKNLIKAGTLAPNDVLREIYEQSILTGDVVNKNKDALIHNYFSDK
jgi:hypothetical protein